MARELYRRRVDNTNKINHRLTGDYVFIVENSQTPSPAKFQKVSPLDSGHRVSDNIEFFDCRGTASFIYKL